MIESQNSYTLTITTDDLDDLKMYTHAKDMYLAIVHVRENIRSHLKHRELNESEIKFLEELQSELYVEGIEL